MEQRIIALFGVVAAAVFIAGCVGQEGQLAFFTGEIAGGEKEEISLSAEHIETARENKDFTLNLLLRPKVDLQDARVDVYDSCLFVNITQQEFFFPKLKANKTEVMKAKYRLGAIDFEQDCELKIRAEYTGNFSVVQTVTVLQEEEFERRDKENSLEQIPKAKFTQAGPFLADFSFSKPLPFRDGGNISMFIDYKNNGKGLVGKVSEGSVSIDYPENALELVRCDDFSPVAGGLGLNVDIGLTKGATKKSTCLFTTAAKTPIVSEPLRLSGSYRYRIDSSTKVKVEQVR